MKKAFMVLFAVLIDGIQTLLLLFAFTLILIPLNYALSLFLTFLAYSILGLGFASNRVNPVGGRHVVRKIITLATTFILEFMPILAQFMPSVTIWVLLTIRQSRNEDREKAKQDAKIQEEKERRIRDMIQRRAQEEMRIAAYQQTRLVNGNIVASTYNNAPALRRPLYTRTSLSTKKAA